MRIFLLFVLLFTGSLHAQDVVHWSASYSKGSSEVIIKAKIKKDWHLYSQYVSPNAGPIPTSVKFAKNKNVKLNGRLIEENAHAIYDENFMAHINVFDDYAILKQKVKVKKNTELEISITYMVCDKTKCLPPKEEKITIKIEK